MRLTDLGLLCLFPVLFILFRAFDRKEWVGLTDEEIDDCFGMDNGFSSYDAIKKAEAKLRSKNT